MNFSLPALQTHSLTLDSDPLKAKAANDWDFILSTLLKFVNAADDLNDLPPFFTLEVCFVFALTMRTFSLGHFFVGHIF